MKVNDILKEDSDEGKSNYNYKWWDDMTPKEKIRSHSQGEPKTVWNPLTKRYSVKFPVEKQQESE